MYKALIVDDERIVRSGIRSSINWNEYDIEMIAEAENGIEALDQVMSYEPDLILLDICMPKMDGLEFASIVKRRFPQIHIVIITGFDDFEYAREALRAGVDDYILKPITKENVAMIVRTQIEKIRAERQNAVYGEKKRSIADVVSDMITGAPVPACVTELAHMLHTDEDTPLWYASLSLYSSGSDIFGDDDSLTRFSVANIADEILREHEAGSAFVTLGNRVAMFMYASVKEPRALLGEIQDNIHSFLQLSVTCSLSSRGRLAELTELRRQALFAKEYTFINPENSIIFYDDVKDRSGDFVYPMEIERTLLDKIAVLSPDESGQLIDSFFDYIKTCGLSETKCKNVLLRFAIGVADTIEYVNGRYLDGNMDISFDPFSINECANMDDARKIIKKIFSDTYAVTSSLRNRTSSHYARIKEYIDTHYSDCDMNLKKCSDELFLSCSYINMILKKEAGKTFVDLLNDKRICVAKELLLLSDVRINEVAYKVGFSHSTYFSTVFKKQTGLTPKAFIQSGG